MSIMSKPFSVQNLVFVHNKIGIPKVRREKICFQSMFSMCNKATVGVGLEFANKSLVFMSSHLPFKSKQTDFGYKQRAEAMKQSLTLVDKLTGGKPYEAVWAGDLNFRVNTPVDETATAVDEQLAHFMKTVNMGRFKEAAINFPPTCKLFEKDKPDCDRNKSAVDTATGSECYHTSTKSGHRTPSYCDRVLSTYPISKYYAWADNDAVHKSDHNIVVAVGTAG
jgi:endonuclease/exonuclease/phosphatase family metal-dependent hydrolase